MNVPVGFDGGDLRVVVVVVIIGGAHEVIRDGVTKKDAEDAVLDSVGLVLVEGDEDEGIVHEMLVVQQRGQEGLQPLASNSDGGVMAIRGHVGGYFIRTLVNLDNGRTY